MAASKRATLGFSLVELSIVLVILGLLVGGVLSGQSLIRSAELRSVITERDRLYTAVNGFKDKYLALPGDITNGYAYWGPRGVAGCASDDNSVNGGCDGDGDGTINYGSGEDLKFFMHLTMAGLLEGAYDGTDNTDGGIAPNSKNVVKSKLGNAYWDVFTQATTGASDYSIGSNGGDDVGTWLVLGIPTGSTYLGQLPTLSNAEALNIDTKTDDGHATTGGMRALNAGSGVCTDSGTDYYTLVADGADTKGHCVLYFSLK